MSGISQSRVNIDVMRYSLLCAYHYVYLLFVVVVVTCYICVCVFDYARYVNKIQRHVYTFHIFISNTIFHYIQHVK